MPCRCDYMEPTAAETRDLTRDKLRVVATWDSSDVETLLQQKGMSAPAIRKGVAEYRLYAEDTIWNGKAPARITDGADAVLHAHILFSGDFRNFWGSERFSHEPVENRVLKASPVVDRVARYGAISKGLFNGDVGEALLACDRILSGRAGVNLAASALKPNPDDAALAALSKSAVVKFLDHDLAWVRRGLAAAGEKFEGDLRGAEKAVYDLLDVATVLAAGARGTSVMLQPAAKAALELFMLDTPEFNAFNEKFFFGALDYKPLEGRLSRI